MERLTTGIAELDLILGGGLPAGSLAVVGGAPGTGKTILANQICFANATPERKAIYYTTFSEPHAKLIRYLEPFFFYDSAAIGDSIEFLRTPVVDDGDALLALADEITRKNFEDRPALIVIDSSKTLHDLADPAAIRHVVYDVASKVSHTDTVLLLVGEYTRQEMETTPESAVADAIVYLSNDTHGSFDQRSLRVLKMRGSAYLTGRHSFQIGRNGLDVYARLEAVPPVAVAGDDARISTGVAGLDALVGGGLPADSATLLAGPSGAGKTLLALHFVAEGIARGERCHYVSFRESERQLLKKAAAFGLDLAGAVASERLTIRHPRPVELVLDAIGADLRAAAVEHRSRRVVIDSLGELESAAQGTGRFQDYLWSLVEFLSTTGAATLLNTETPAFFGGAFELTRGMTFATENLILLQYTESEGHIGRRVNVVMMRDSDHAKDPHEYTIGPHGFEIVPAGGHA